jgi:hypothetical protein
MQFLQIFYAHPERTCPLIARHAHLNLLHNHVLSMKRGCDVSRRQRDCQKESHNDDNVPNHPQPLSPLMISTVRDRTKPLLATLRWSRLRCVASGRSVLVCRLIHRNTTRSRTIGMLEHQSTRSCLCLLAWKLAPLSGLWTFVLTKDSGRHVLNLWRLIVDLQTAYLLWRFGQSFGRNVKAEHKTKALLSAVLALSEGETVLSDPLLHLLMMANEISCADAVVPKDVFREILWNTKDLQCMHGIGVQQIQPALALLSKFVVHGRHAVAF